MESGNGHRVSFTTKGNEGWYEEWAIPNDIIASCGGIGAWKVVNESSVVVGGNDSGLVRLLRLSRGTGWFRVPASLKVI